MRHPERQYNFSPLIALALAFSGIILAPFAFKQGDLEQIPITTKITKSERG